MYRYRPNHITPNNYIHVCIYHHVLHARPRDFLYPEVTRVQLLWLHYRAVLYSDDQISNVSLYSNDRAIAQ